MQILCHKPYVVLDLFKKYIDLKILITESEIVTKKKSMQKKNNFFSFSLNLYFA